MTGGWLGLGRPRWIEAAKVVYIEAAGRTHSSNKTWYDVIVVRDDGKRITVAKRLPGQCLANSIIRRIKRALGKAT